MRFGLFGRARRDRELEEEIRAHLAMAVRDRVSRGEDPQEAEHAARREFGNEALVRELTRRMWGWGWLERLAQDLRFAFRSFVRKPLVTIAAVASLALGIGTAASAFSGVDIVLFRPLPYPAADRLVSVRTTDPDRGLFDFNSSWPDFVDWRSASRSLELAAYHHAGVNLAGGEQPERLTGYDVSAGFLAVLGVKPRIGRGFVPGDEGASAAHVVILSDAVWHRDFGADPAIVGRTVDLDGAPSDVVGVLPPGFQFDGPVDVLVPFRPQPNSDRWVRFLGVVGRLRPGATMSQARSEMHALQAGLASAYPDTNQGTSVAVRSLKDEWFPEHYRQTGVIAGVAVLFVLLIACANVANLLLAQGAGREREIALRSALGAGRGRIGRQLLTESVVLGLLGGTVGLGLSVAGIRWMQGVAAGVPQMARIALDGRVLAFALVATLGSGILFGLAPVIQAARSDLRGSLSGAGRSGSGHSGGGIRRALVVAEIALSFMLLVSATLLVQAFSALSTKSLGFDTDHRVTAHLTLPTTKYPKEEVRHEFFSELVDRVAALPGVTAVGLTSQLPLHGANLTYYTIPGEPPVAPARRPSAPYRLVSPGYFRTMGIPVLAGRTFTTKDVEDTPRVMVVNRRFADLHWPGASPLGHEVQIGSDVWQIVGLVGNTYDFGPDKEPPAVFYQPIYQLSPPYATLVVETDQVPSAFLGTLRATVRSIDPNEPLYSAQTVRELLGSWLGRYSAMTEFLGAAALLAFLLAAVGVYGVMGYSVARRTQEVGVRVALGAARRDVLRLILRQGGALAAVGIGIGLAASFATTRFLKLFLYEVSPVDPATFAAVTIVLLLTCLAASWIPALRATRVDPTQALKVE